MTNKIKIAISIFSITVMVACLVQAIPKYIQLQQYKTIIEENTAQNTIVSTADETVAKTKGSTTDEISDPRNDYKTTQEYKDTQDRIDALQERVRLLKNGLTSDLTDITKTVFNHITEISANPDDEALVTECRQFMTDDYYNKFKDMVFERESYMVYDIKFSDLDKDDISAYVLTRSSNQFRFFITYSFDPDKSYVISNIIQITNKE